jgi:hypothetical protein
MRREEGCHSVDIACVYPPNFADHIQRIKLRWLSMMLDCHRMAQSIKAIVTAATVNATPNCDSLTGSPKRRNDFIVGLSPRTHEPILYWFIRPCCARRKDLHAAALNKHFGKRRAKSSGKPSKL